jgi:Fe-S-cluster-containing hydrogenase component 2
LRYFRDEYEAHLYDRKCPAGACSGLLVYRINPDLCKGCGLCARKCPEGAIVGEKRNPFVVVEDKCIKCGVCIHSCPFEAIYTA